MKCYNRMLGITWKECRTNEYVWGLVEAVFGGQRPERLMQVVQRRILTFFGHQSRRDGWTKQLIQGRCYGSRYQVRPMRVWQDNIRDWTGLGRQARSHHTADMERWRASVRKRVHQRPSRLRAYRLKSEKSNIVAAKCFYTSLTRLRVRSQASLW
eukprot:gene11253-biopygen11519